jgi:uncharacterized protein YggE
MINLLINHTSSFYVIFFCTPLLNPLNIAAIVGLVLVLAFAVVLIQPENNAESQNDDINEMIKSEIHGSMSFDDVHSSMMDKHHSMIKSLTSDTIEHTISVTGTAQKSVEPNLLVIEFGVETNDDTAKSALNSNSDLLSNAISKLNSLGISDDDLSTSRFTITPLYDYYQDKETGRHTSELIGYQVTNLLTVKTEKLDLAADILDSVVSSGVNKVNSVSFTVSPQYYSTVKDSLIEDAIQNAKSKAENALSPLDQKIIGVQSITLDDFAVPTFTPMMRAFAEDVSFGSTPVFSSDITISTSAKIVFLISNHL